jgi:predicted DNA-binding antitoxin AbrB/MazE fold protein
MKFGRKTMTTTVEAIYEKGVLRLTQPIPLDEGTKVQITITTPETVQKIARKAGRFSWERTPRLQDEYAGSAADELMRQRREE